MNTINKILVIVFCLIVLSSCQHDESDIRPPLINDRRFIDFTPTLVTNYMIITNYNEEYDDFRTF